MRHCRKSNSLLLGLILSVPATAHAHTVNTDVRGFCDGMLYPLMSLEYLLPVMALALLVSQRGRQAIRWTLMVFPLSLTTGILIGRLFSPASFFHIANLATLPILGGMLIYAGRISSKTVVERTTSPRRPFRMRPFLSVAKA